MKQEIFNGKTVDDAINKAIMELRVSSDQLGYEVIDKGSNGILGIGARPATIKAWALAQDEGMNLLIGMRQPANVADTVKALDITLSREEVLAMEEIVKSIQVEVLDK